MSSKASSAVDPVTLEVVRNALIALVVEMTDNLIRTAYSPIAAEIKDFSIGLLDPDGNTIAQAPNGVPMFCADLNATIKKGMELFGAAGFQPGDVVLSNDVETNGQHVNNMAVYTPIFDGDRLVAFAAVRSHWIDVGGMAVGSMPGNARDIFSEGIQLPTVKIYRAGVVDEAILRIVRVNTRFPDMVVGDMHAQISACRLGERRFRELLDRYGSEQMDQCVERIWDEAETISRRAVEAIPDGVYEAACQLDNDGLDLSKPIPLKVKVIVAGSDVTIDFSEMSPQVAGPYNSRASETIGRVAFKYLTTPHLPTTEGAFRNLKIVCPVGCILNAHPTAPMSWFNMAVVSSIDLVLKALYPAMPTSVTAGSADNIGLANITGVDPRSKALFQTFVPFIGGLGARPNKDGTSAVVSLVQGDVHFMPIEVQEVAYPIRVTELALRPDSGGAGLYRGGLGVVFGREMLTDCALHARYERTTEAPWGVSGGGEGQVTHVSVRRRSNDEDSVVPTKCEDFPLHKGDVELTYTAGGGAYGDPFTRDPARVCVDVLAGYVSVEAARAQYGVVIDKASGSVDLDATERLRRAK